MEEALWPLLFIYSLSRQNIEKAELEFFIGYHNNNFTTQLNQCLTLSRLCLKVRDTIKIL